LIKIAICDNTKNDIENEGKKLEGFAKELGIKISIEKFTSGEELLNVYEIADDFPPIIFLEINLQGIDGLSVAKKLRNDGYMGEIIFHTKSKSEVFVSFDVDAFHYIVKGETSLSREKEIFVHAYEEIKKAEEEFITVSYAGECMTIPLKQIKYFGVNKNLVEVHYGTNKVFKFYTSLAKISHSLIDKGFVRLSKSVIVNLIYVNKKTKSDVFLTNGKAFEMGRAYKKDADLLIDEYFRSKEVLRI
jgi:DNA-binding LytR/AlgR family response regulator